MIHKQLFIEEMGKQLLQQTREMNCVEIFL
jgi:hypothetical protein